MLKVFHGTIDATKEPFVSDEGTLALMKSFQFLSAQLRS